MCERCVSKEQLFNCLLEKVSDPTTVIEWDEDCEAWRFEKQGVCFDFVGGKGQRIRIWNSFDSSILLDDPERKVYLMLADRRRAEENERERKTIGSLIKALKGK